MKIYSFKNFLTLFSLVFMLAAAGCSEKNTVGNASMLSGADSKTWKTTKETTASGEKNKVTSEEKKQVIQFFANGSFSMRSPTQNASGKWTYDAMARNLSMQFVGSDMTLSYRVVNLSDDDLTMQTPDGSQMVMEAD